MDKLTYLVVGVAVGIVATHHLQKTKRQKCLQEQKCACEEKLKQCVLEPYYYKNCKKPKKF